jgi:hypothetical protein
MKRGDITPEWARLLVGLILASCIGGGRAFVMSTSILSGYLSNVFRLVPASIF